MMNPNKVDQQLVSQVVSAVSKVSGYIRQEFGKVNLQAADIKSAKSFVSYVDREAEIQLSYLLKTILPEAGFITEEKETINERKAYSWVIDPLDGTTNFLYNIPVFAISVALKLNDQCVLGVVSDVMNNSIYSTLQGGGSFKNGIPIQVSQRKTLSECIVATGFPYQYTSDTEHQVESLKKLIKITNGIRRFGSAAIDLVYLAEGIFDAYYEFDLNEWDTAAGMLIVREAGGICSDRLGNEEYQTGLEIVASNGLVHQELLEVIK
jgi:myo-inositol-1(or 4)-monophosphatase